jgi:8-oxo-dGTP pyrophosphatase MutT (NUDIX family)
MRTNKIMKKDRAMAARITEYRLEVEDKPWAYAEKNAASIDAHWQQALPRNPGFFDGRVFVLDDFAVQENRLEGTFRATSFSAYLHWRDNNFDLAYGHDGFVCAIVTSSDGRVLLAEATTGTLNDGLRLLPGGMIDRRDVTRGGLIDVRSAACRELAEETGLSEAEVQPASHLYVALCGHLVAMGVQFVSRLTASELKCRTERYLATREKPELAAPIFAAPADIHACDKTPEYVRRLLAFMGDATEQA